jgi:hypothetical protein
MTEHTPDHRRGSAAGRYRSPLCDLGMDNVKVRNLGWRMWWTGPWLATRLVSAAKPDGVASTR